MPIYEYRCSACGYEHEYLQKVSDPRLTTCPECGKATFDKQVSAAGFQLKGNGWYATDFKNSGAKPKTGKDAGDKTTSDKDGGDKPKTESAEPKKDEKAAPAGSGASPPST
ncbi:MAG: FmdB family zinc ribbon protein [Burkholderiales bacterium]